MSNIYNLQQVSLNSRIVAVEGTFDHIDANNINANINAGVLTVSELNATDPVNGIKINSRILVDEINENNTGFGVSFPNTIYANVIEELTGLSGTSFPTNIKTDFIEGYTSSEIGIIGDFKADNILANFNDNVKIAQSEAYTLSNEYGHYTFLFTGVMNGTGFYGATGIGTVNAGVSPYLPDNQTLYRLTVNETGIYSMNITCFNTSALPNIADSYVIRIVNTNGDVLCSNNSVCNTTTAFEYYISTSFIGLLTLGDVLIMEMCRDNGLPSAVDFESVFYITRLK